MLNCCCTEGQALGITAVANGIFGVCLWHDASAGKSNRRVKQEFVAWYEFGHLAWRR